MEIFNAKPSLLGGMHAYSLNKYLLPAYFVQESPILVLYINLPGK